MSENTTKKTVVTRRYVEVFNIDHAIEIARQLKSNYRKVESNVVNTFNGNICEYWIDVPKGKWGESKTIAKYVVGHRTSKCVLVRFITVTDDNQIKITTS